MRRGDNGHGERISLAERVLLVTAAVIVSFIVGASIPVVVYWAGKNVGAW